MKNMKYEVKMPWYKTGEPMSPKKGIFAFIIEFITNRLTICIVLLLLSLINGCLLVQEKTRSYQMKNQSILPFPINMLMNQSGLAAMDNITGGVNPLPYAMYTAPVQPTPVFAGLPLNQADSETSGNPKQ